MEIFTAVPLDSSSSSSSITQEESLLPTIQEEQNENDYDELNQHTNNTNNTMSGFFKRKSSVAIGGMGLICGIVVCTITTLAATTLYLHFLQPADDNTTNTNRYISNNMIIFATPTKTKLGEMMTYHQIVEYTFLKLVLIIGYVLYYAVCLSSIVHLFVIMIFPTSTSSTTSTSWITPSSYDGCHSFVKTLSFQSGFFAGIALTFLIVQGVSYHLLLPTTRTYSENNNDAQDQSSQIFTFIAASADRLMMVFIISCALLGAKKKMKKGGQVEKAEAEEDDEIDIES